jgi:myosin heavy subunit
MRINFWNLTLDILLNTPFFELAKVRYTANGLVEKNVETLSNELKALANSSSIEQARDILLTSLKNQTPTESSGGGSRRSMIRGVSVGSQFRSSLQALVADLERTQPHYIRCVKPNLNKAASSFDSGEVLRQLRYAGMMETIRIRREGYALRENHEMFYSRFSMLLDSRDLNEGGGIAHMVKVLSTRLNVTDADWQVGHSKVFLRRELADKLEILAKLKIQQAARTIGRFGRMVAEDRASSLLTAWGRCRVHMLRLYYARLAVARIYATYRMYKQQQCFNAIVFTAVKLQSLQRKAMAKEVAKKLRDPYGDMDFDQLEQVYVEMLSKLDEAVIQKQFQIAAQMEIDM